MIRRTVGLLMAMAAIAAGTADAQTREPIGPFVVDVRGTLPRFKETPNVADALGVTTDNIPGRGLGLVFGAHWYPARKGPVTLGLGAELLLSRGSETLEPATEGATPGPTVNTRFSSFAPHVSLNFGARRGWSYISGGYGWVGFTTELEADPVGDAASRPTAIHFGGGARWFAARHVAFSFDLRYYSINEQPATPTRPSYPNMTLMVLSAGVSVK